MSQGPIYIPYNEYVMGDYDYYEDLENDIVIYDDSDEWYNIDDSEADVWVTLVWGGVTVALETLDLFVWVRILAPELLARRSTVDQAAVNRWVVGSNPTEPVGPIV